MRGRLVSRTRDRSSRTPLRAVRSAPSIRGDAASNRFQKSASVWRLSSSIRGKRRRRERSIKSPRVTRSSMPVRTTGRCASKMISSSSEYSSRVPNPPPVERRHSASLNHGSRCERLSSAIIHELFAAITRSRSSRGSDRSAAVFGSMTERSARAVEDLAVPCSP